MPAERKKNLVTPEFRGSYVHLMKPKQKDEGEPQYEMAIVLPKNDRATKDFISKLEAEFEDAMQEKFGKVIPFEKCKHYPVKDGDDSNQEEFHGNWIISTKNNRQPGILIREEDGTRRAVESDGEIYSGMWCHASVRVYCWDNKFGKGVSVSLEGVLKTKDDQKFGGSFSEDDFDGVSKGGDRPARRSRDEDDDRPARRSRDEDDDRPSRRDRDDRPTRRSRDDNDRF